MESLFNLISERFTAEHIASELRSLNKNTDPNKVLSYMRDEKFDVLGAEDNSKKLIGYFEKDANSRGVELRDITPQVIISSNANLKDVISKLQDKHFLFVIDKTEINKIITKADVGKQPFRIFLFGIISTFEIVISELIRKNLGEEEIKKKLFPSALKKAENIYKDKMEENVDTDFVDCLQLVDKKEIILKTKELISALKIESKSKFNRNFVSLSHYRNNLAHGSAFVKSQDDIEKIFEVINFAKEYTARVVDTKKPA
jgi:hypothetical protein